MMLNVVELNRSSALSSVRIPRQHIKLCFRFMAGFWAYRNRNSMSAPDILKVEFYAEWGCSCSFVVLKPPSFLTFSA